jgi:endonuclease V-like protein UPF0215 family
MFRSRFRNTSSSLRIIGVDDGTFRLAKRAKQRALLAAVLYQNSRITNLRLGLIEVDGKDARRELESMLRGVKLDVVMLSGISFAGFNLIDIRELVKSIRKPVIAISKDRPANAAVQRALRKHFDDWRDRWRIVQNAGPVYHVRPHPEDSELYFEVKGATPSFARRAIVSTAEISRLPEPIRIAGIVARGLSALTPFHHDLS